MTDQVRFEHQCPQCGAPVILAETDRLFTCPFCRVRLFIHYRRAPRCTLAVGAEPAGGDLVHVPYWRFRGMGFAVGLDAVHWRVLDQSVRAVERPLFPATLGLRPQALTLRALQPETPGAFYGADLKRKDFVAELARSFEQHLSDEATQPFHQAFVGETVQLIYAPFWVERHRVRDAVTGAVLAGTPEPGWPVAAETAAIADSGSPVFMPTLCPHCGWDLEGEKDALVLLCRNCDRAWQAGSGGLQPLPLSALQPESDADLWLPFWSIEAGATDLELASYGDFIRLTNQTRVPTPDRENQPFRFLVPACKVNPQRFLHLGAWMTLEQPQPQPLEKLPRTLLHPVNLAPVEGFQSVLALLAQLTVAKKKLLPRLVRAHLAFKSYQLVFVPFRGQGVEWVQLELGFALPANALHWGRRL